MKSSLFFWGLLGLTFSTALGTLFHFLYLWTGFLPLTPFCAVNESTWEHMKIFFFPAVIFALLQYPFFGKGKQNFWQIKLVSTLTGTLLIPLLFYTYQGAFGTPPGWLNVLFFFLSAGIAYLFEGILFKRDAFSSATPLWPILTLSILSACFFVFTFLPPILPLFQDPVSGLYGIV